MILDQDVEAIKYLARNIDPLETVKIYHYFTDKYRGKHTKSIKTTDNEEYLKRRGEVFYKYCRIYYNAKSIIKREMKDW